MRACLLALAALACPSFARAGLHLDNPAEPGRAVPIEKARSTILGLRAAAVEPEGRLSSASPRALYLTQLSDLEKKRRTGLFTAVDRANLGGCLIRLGRAKEAIDVLKEGRTTDHFFIQTNLALAYFVTHDLRNAIATQERLLRTWPAVWPGWNRPALEWQRECERALLRLMHSRAAEAGAKPGELDLDPLFRGVRYVAADGTYKAGEIAPRYADLLPGRAIDIVLQLCLWLPGDTRLMWQLAELFNAAGQVDFAHDILYDLRWGGGGFKGLHQHRQVLAAALPVMQGLRSGELWVSVLSAGQAVPLPNLVPGPAGAAALVVSAWGPVVALPGLKPKGPAVDPGAFPFRGEDGGTRTSATELNWRHVGASFGFGALATLLLGLQWREWQRRRAQRREGEARPEPRPPELLARDDRITQAPGGPS